MEVYFALRVLIEREDLIVTMKFFPHPICGCVTRTKIKASHLYPRTIRRRRKPQSLNPFEDLHYNHVLAVE